MISARGMTLDRDNWILKCGKLEIKQGDIITVDGSSGTVYMGAVPTVPAGQDEDFRLILRWADRYKGMKVMANAETFKDTTKAR